MKSARSQRKKMVFGKATSFAEHERHNVQFWQNVSYADKLQAMVDLIHESWYLKHPNEPAPRLDRSTHGFGRLGPSGKSI
jgi:hypothetical protein